MARKINDKKLEADIPCKLHDELNDWIDTHKHVKIRQCAQAMIELFLSVPEELQAIFLISSERSFLFNRAKRKAISNTKEPKEIELTDVCVHDDDKNDVSVN